MARLDRLGPAKEVIQVGAVIGGEFTYDLLSAVHPFAEEDLQRALRDLADAELLYVRGIAPEATYLFKHALIRDAAYEALLRSRRKDLHRRVARAIDEKFRRLGEAHPEVLARHWTEAGETEPAIAQWSRAGKAAEARNAFREALESYHQALALLNTLPESPERDLRELELGHSVVEILKVTSGYSAPETIAANDRIAALAEKGANLNLMQLFTQVSARWAAAHLSGDLAAADALAEQLLQLGLREGSPTSLAIVHMTQVMTRLSRGDLAGVEEHFTAGCAFFDDPGFRRGPGYAVSTFGYAILTAWLLGRSDVARQRAAQMMAAADPNNPFDVAMAQNFASLLHVNLREYEPAEASQSAIELSEQHRFPFIAATCRCILGHARAQLGRAIEGLELIRRGFAGLTEIGMRGTDFEEVFLAAAQERTGASADALATVEQALQAKPREPAALRMRGELRLKQARRSWPRPTSARLWLTRAP